MAKGSKPPVGRGTNKPKDVGGPAMPATKGKGKK